MTTTTVKIYIISLKNEKDRRKHVEKQLKGLPWVSYEFFDAIDAKNLTASEISELATKETHHLSLGEIGCAASHLAVYKKMIADNVPYAVVMEDDVLIGKAFKTIGSLIIENIFSLNEEPTVLLLNSMNSTYYYKRARYDFGTHKLHKAIDSKNTEAYVLNLAAAKKILPALEPIHIAADNWKIILHLCRDVACLACIPHLATQNIEDFSSGLEAGRQEMRLSAQKQQVKFSLKKIISQLHRHFRIYIQRQVIRYKP